MGLPTPPHGIRSSILLAKLALSGLLLAILFWRVDRAAFLRSIQALPLSLFLGCVALFALCFVISTLRWRALLQAERILVPFWRLLLVYFEGAFFNLFLPTLIGGDIVRGYYIYKMTQGNDAALASILVDRLSGFAVLMVIAVGSLAVAYRTLDDPLAAVLVLGPTVFFACLMLVLLNDRLKDVASGLLRVAGLARFQAKLQGLVEALHRYRRHHRALGQALLWSALLQVLIIVTYYLIGVGLGVGVPLGSFFVLVPIVTVVSMLPISVAGLGLREAAVVYFFAKLGVDAGAALGMSLIWFSLTLIVSSSGGLAYLLDTHAAKRIEG